MKRIYRIKINEQNDGTLWYVPQVTYPYSKLAKIFGCKHFSRQFFFNSLREFF